LRFAICDLRFGHRTGLIWNCQFAISNFDERF
jgi:hypothetical protein